MNPAPAVMELQGVGVSFGSGEGVRCIQALQQIDLSVCAGERVALVGANGSGKSTLLRVLHGLIKPSSGSISRSAGQRQTMLFQRPHMLRMTALNNIALGLWLGGQAWTEAKAQALVALERVNLAALAQRQAQTLSGGQQQRLALARAWIGQPDVLLLDEPTASLDPHAKREVEGLMAEFTAHADEPAHLTMVFASHNLGQVKRLAGRVVYLEQGRVLADLPVHDFFNAERLQQVSGAAQLFVKGELA